VNTPETALPTQTRSVSLYRKILNSLGPGIIIAAVIFGPSKMTITSKMGAQYGYQLLWVIVISIFFLIVFTNMAARIALATNHSLLTSIRKKWGNGVAVACGIGVFLVAVSFQAGNSTGVGISVAEANGTDKTIWIIVFNVFGISLLFFRKFYKVLETLMIVLILVKLFAFFTNLFMARPSVAGIARGLVPSMERESLGLVIAFFASTFSIIGALYQSYLVQERKKANPLATDNHNSLTGIVLLGIMSAAVMICAAAVLNRQGIEVTSATDMARALEPLLGKYAATLFLIGLFSASFSALVGNATIGGTLLGDALGYGHELTSNRIKFMIAMVMAIGAIVAVSFGKTPLQLIVFAQSVTIFLVPFIGIAMFTISNDKKIMGKYKNSIAVNIVAVIGLSLLVFLAFTNVKELFFK
jgi:manganese transport protein